jgi:membrane-associated phospholipid phosphatase
MTLRRRAALYAAFLGHTFAYLQAFKLPHRDHEAQRRRLRARYVIRADRAIGWGVVPGARLQRLRRYARVRTALDRGLGTIYFAWAPQRHVALLWLAARHPRSFPRVAALVCATFDVSLAYQAAVPTAPPWWAAQQRLLSDRLDRVTVDASRALPLVPEENADARQEANPWASMPSNHTASAVALALALRDVDRRVGTAAGAYAAALGFALVYLGEHYVVDVLAGAALAAGLHTSVSAALARAQR